MKNIVILGSTGSIGTQALNIIENYPNLFHASVLTANVNWELLAYQALKHHPEVVVIGDNKYYSQLKNALSGTNIDVRSGAEEIKNVAAHHDSEMVLTAMVGYSGLIPTINAIKAGKTIALANKETLVVAGELITKLKKEYKTDIIPVDSEHSAIFQCLLGEKRSEMKKILLTASGGPFRKLSWAELEKVTVKEALHHPNWHMGAKVTIDSASMMNKGFEMIEAKWLFSCEPGDIEILVHPQSIIHSMVEFNDGSTKAQLGVPDMRIPIQFAFSYPKRLPADERQLNWKEINELTFELPDIERFPLLGLAFQAIEKGGNMPCILNAANEVAVKAFIEGKISFTKMPKLVEAIMEKMDFKINPDLDDLISTNKKSREMAQNWLVTYR